MFGAQSDEQGRVIAMACLANGCDPLTIPQTFHLIKGRLSMRSDAMLGRLARVGSYEVIERTPDAVELAAECHGRKYKQRFTWEEAKQETFVYKDKDEVVLQKLAAGKANELTLSANYATPRRRMQMMWARVCSDVVRVVAPELITGTYVPDEVREGLIADGKATESEAQAACDAAETVQDDVTDAEFEPKQATPTQTTAPQATGEQITRITGLFQELGVPADIQLAALHKRGATDMSDLSSQGADDIIAQLEGMKANASAAAQDGPVDLESKADPNATQEHIDGPVSQLTINQITQEFERYVQLPSDDGSTAKAGQRLAEKMAQHGLTKLSHLSQREAEALLAGIRQKDLEKFFSMQLSGYKQNTSKEDGGNFQS